MGSQPNMNRKTTDEVPTEEFKQPSQPAALSQPSSSQSEPVEELSQKLEELSSQENVEDDGFISDDSQVEVALHNQDVFAVGHGFIPFPSQSSDSSQESQHKAAKKRPIEDDEKMSPTKKAHVDTPNDNQQNSQGAQSEGAASEESYEMQDPPSMEIVELVRQELEEEAANERRKGRHSCSF